MSKEKFIVIPAQVLYDKELRPIAKLLYGEIRGLTEKEGFCFASNDYFAGLYGYTPTAISIIISALCRSGYVKVEFVNGRRRMYVTKKTKGVIQKNKGACLNRQGGLDQKDKHNNTVNNTDNIKNNKSAYGEHKNIFLTDEEIRTLKYDFPAIRNKQNQSLAQEETIKDNGNGVIIE